MHGQNHLKGTNVLKGAAYCEAGSRIFLRVFIFTAWIAVRRLTVFEIFCLSRCRDTKISKEEVFVYFRFLENQRFVNVSLRFLLCTFLGAFAKLLKATTRVVISVRPSAWSNSVPTGLIFVKFVISLFFLNPLRKFHFY